MSALSLVMTIDFNILDIVEDVDESYSIVFNVKNVNKGAENFDDCSRKVSLSNFEESFSLPTNP